MALIPTKIFIALLFIFYALNCKGAKINTPRVLLPWFENLTVNFTFEIIEGGCYTWSLSRDDIIDLEPLYEDTWGHCSHAARVSVSKTCVPPGSVIILAEEVNSGEILRGDVDIDEISSLKVTSTTWKLYLEEAPEAFEVVAYDDQGNKFSTLEGVSFLWSIENLGNNVGEDNIVTLVRWGDTDYEAPRGVSELESQGLRAHSVLLYGQAIGECRIKVCLNDICTNFNLKVVASVVLTPATAMIVPGDTLRYRVVRARAGRLTIQDVADTFYNMKVPQTGIAVLEDTVSLVRGTEVGTTSILLTSGVTEVATATLTVAEPHTIRVHIRPSNLVIQEDNFLIHAIIFDKHGHAFTAGNEILIRLMVEGEANVDLIQSTENGTLTDAVAHNAGPFKITARLHSIAGKLLHKKVEGEVSAVAVETLKVLPPELFVAWTDSKQDIPLQYSGGGDEPVVWSMGEISSHSLSLTPSGILTVKGIGEMDVRVQLKNYPHVQAYGKVYSALPELVQVSSSGQARVGRPHLLHVALTAARTNEHGELYNFHVCDCASFTVSLLEGPEPQNVTAATWIEPIEGACCVLQCSWKSRGVSTVRVSRGRAGDTTRVAVRAAPALLWPRHAAALVGATVPVLADGEALIPHSSEPRIAELSYRDGPLPHQYPDIQLFTMKCRRKGDSRLELVSQMEDERESVEFEAACAPHVSRIRLEPSETPGNCSGGPKVWLRPGHEVTVKVTLLDAIGRELLDERGPRTSWEIEPHHRAIEFKATDRLFIETHPEYAPVPVPFKYYQLVTVDDKAIGWNGALKMNIPEATASIQARVVGPLICEPMKVNLAWEGESVNDIASVTGGSGRYSVETPKGVSATVSDGSLSVHVPGPGSYDVVVTDLCVHGEKQIVEVHIEEILSVEVSTARAICVGGCVPVTALVKGVSHRYLSVNHAPEWRVNGDVVVKDGNICGLREGTGRVRAALSGVWSPEVEVLVFPPLAIVPEKARLPPGARLQLRHRGGPPPHLASLHYRATTRQEHVEVSPSGFVHGMSMGSARVRLVATDIANVEMASAEAEVEVIPISGLRVRAATQTLLVGSPGPVWVEAGSLPPSALASLHPPPRLTWSLRDPTTARIYTTHADDYLERSVAEGLSVRVVPLKPGVITIDVRVRNMGQVADTRSWDSTIEILGISDIRVAVEGLSKEFKAGNRLSLAVGSTIRLKSLPKSYWKSYSDGAFDVTASGELNALTPGHGVIVAQHKDERNNIYRETVLHVEVAVPHYCTAEPSGDADDNAIILVSRDSIGRELIAASNNITAFAPGPLVSHVRRSVDSALGSELLIPNLDAIGAFVSFQSTLAGVTVRDEVWVTGSDTRTDRVIATSGWGVCLEGVGWRAPPSVSVYAGSGVSLALLTQDITAKHQLKLDRPPLAQTVQQIPFDKISFAAGEWPASMVPLTIEAGGLTDGPLLCSEDQKYALEGLQVELPYACRTKAPYTATPVLDIVNGQLGCSIVPSSPITDPAEVELCAEWGVSRTCTRVLLLPQIHVSHNKVSLLHPPTTFSITGHPRALKLVKITSSPGLKLDLVYKDSEITVVVKNEASTCGLGFVNVRSKLTGQEERVEVERECDVACGTVLEAIFAILKPYLPSLFTIAAVAVTYLFIQSKLQQKAPIRMPTEPIQTVLPPSVETSPSFRRSRTFSRSPYASNGPSSPVYGDASTLPDTSFSPNTTRMHSRFL